MSNARRHLRIGTRTSPMAMRQTAIAVEQLTAEHPGLEVAVVPMVASGDRHTGDLAEIGGKGAWVRELDAALAAGEVDATVSSAKDLPGPHDRPAGTVIGAILARDEVRDALVVPRGMPRGRLADLPPGSRIGTSAPRRTAQLRRLRPDVTVKTIRGNANTRLSKLDSSGEYDALILAAAGLERIGASERVSELLPVESMCPAAGAGIIVIEYREGDTEMAELLRPLTDPDAFWALTAEKAVLAGLQGSCQSAVAASARIAHGEVALRATVWGAGKALEANGTAPFSYAEQLGGEIAGELLAQGATQLLEAGATVPNPDRT